MSSNEEKDHILHIIYYSPDGYGSKLTTYKDARLKDPKMTMEYVSGWFDGHVINRKQPGGRNSFVAPHPFYEFQIDLFWVADLKKQKFRVGCLCIDIFTKYATVVPIKSKTKDQTSPLVFFSASKK
jgi:hypothetical protein